MGSKCFNGLIHDSTHCQTLSNQTILKYKFGELIGSGSLGQVSVAQNVKKKRKYAIKTIQKFSALKNKCINNILREKQILIKNKHSYIVNIAQAFQDKIKLYLVLQYMPNGDLRDLLRQRRLNEIESKFIITCVLLALEYLSNKSITHGDIKPQNILIDQKKFFRVGDFSSAYYNNQKQNKINGTYGYIAPQTFTQIQSNVQNKRTDIYSLGMILSEMIFGTKHSSSHKKSFITQETKQNQHSNVCSSQCLDFIQNATCQNWRKRLTITQAINHPWIGLTGSLRQNFMKKNPQINPFNRNKDYFNYKKRDPVSHQQSDCDQLAASILLQTTKIQKMFESYSYHPKSKFY